MEEAQDKAKHGGDKSITVNCDAPEGFDTWEAWEADVRRKKELKRLEKEKEG